MVNEWVLFAAGVVVVLAGVRFLLPRRPAVAFADAREERLSLQLARSVGCPVDEALEAVRREVQIAPDQTDETILRRARYHHQRECPDRPLPVYRERGRAPG
jgi:hypothetical protein